MQKIRNTFSAGVAAAALIITAHAAQKVETPTMKNQTLPPIADDTRIFRLNPEIATRELRFSNRFGIELAGHLYLPKGFDPAKRYAAVAVCGPFGVSIFLTRGCPISVNGPVGESETAAPIHLPPPTLPFPSAQ